MPLHAKPSRGKTAQTPASSKTTRQTEVSTKTSTESQFVFPENLSQRQILALQRIVGNQAVQRMLRTSHHAVRGESIQRKLAGSHSVLSSLPKSDTDKLWAALLRTLSHYEDSERTQSQKQQQLAKVRVDKAAAKAKQQPAPVGGGGWASAMPTGLMEQFTRQEMDIKGEIQRQRDSLIRILRGLEGMILQYLAQTSHLEGAEKESAQATVEYQRHRKQQLQGQPGVQIPEKSLEQITLEQTGSQAEADTITRRRNLEMLWPRVRLELQDVLTGRDLATAFYESGQEAAATPMKGGAISSLEAVTYKSGEKGVVKFEETLASPDSPSWMIGREENVLPQAGARSVATSRIEELVRGRLQVVLAAAQKVPTFQDNKALVTRTEFATHKPSTGGATQFAIYMEEAEGRKASDIATKDIAAGTTQLVTSASARQAAQEEERAKMFNIADAVLQQGLIRLQMLDVICGQIDRHWGNYYVIRDETGQVIGVQGIDNDESFGSTQMDPKKQKHQYRGIPPLVDRDYALAILQITPEELQSAVTGLLDPKEVAAMVERFRRFHDSLREMQAQNLFVDNWDETTAQTLQQSETSYYQTLADQADLATYLKALTDAGLSKDDAKLPADKLQGKVKTGKLTATEAKTTVARFIARLLQLGANLSLVTEEAEAALRVQPELVTLGYDAEAVFRVFTILYTIKSGQPDYFARQVPDVIKQFNLLSYGNPAAALEIATKATARGLPKIVTELGLEGERMEPLQKANVLGKWGSEIARMWTGGFKAGVLTLDDINALSNKFGQLGEDVRNQLQTTLGNIRGGDEAAKQGLVWKNMLQTGNWNVNAAKVLAENLSRQALLKPEDEVKFVEGVASKLDGKAPDVFKQLWQTSFSQTQKQRLYSTMSGENGLKLSSLGYLLEAVDEQHRYGLGTVAFDWYFDKVDVDFWSYIPQHKRAGGLTQVRYFTPEERQQFQLNIAATITQTDNTPLDGTNIFVMTSDKVFYGCPKQRGIVNHSSFLAGLPVKAAGQLILNGGTLTGITTSSGHYTPSRKDLVEMLQFMQSKGVDLTHVTITDMATPEEMDQTGQSTITFNAATFLQEMTAPAPAQQAPAKKKKGFFRWFKKK